MQPVGDSRASGLRISTSLVDLSSGRSSDRAIFAPAIGLRFDKIHVVCAKFSEVRDVIVVRTVDATPETGNPLVPGFCFESRLSVVRAPAMLHYL